MLKKIFLMAMAGFFAVLSFNTSASAGTLEEVKARGYLVCGVDGGLRGFASPDDSGKIVGIDADTCRGVAAAVFGDASKVEFVPLTAKERFTALSSGEVDILSRNTTHTLTRDTTLGINFTYYNYIDGQGFLVRKDLGIGSALELDGALICVQSGTTTERNLATYFKANSIEFTPISYSTSVQTREGLANGACDVLTSDKSQLAAIRSDLKDSDNFIILPETISKEPLGPVVRQGDDAWFNIVKWSLWGMINADELGVSQANVDSMMSSENPAIRVLLGLEGDRGTGLGLDNKWLYNIIKQVGNYNDIYVTNLEPIGLSRPGTVNASWMNGGLIYAPPL